MGKAVCKELRIRFVEADFFRDKEVIKIRGNPGVFDSLPLHLIGAVRCRIQTVFAGQLLQKLHRSVHKLMFKCKIVLIHFRRVFRCRVNPKLFEKDFIAVNLHLLLRQLTKL